MKDPETEPTFAVAPSFEHDADAVDRKSPKRRHIMSQEQLQAFISQVQASANLQEQIKAAHSAKEVESIIKQQGVVLNQAVDNELTGRDLEIAAGSNGCFNNSNSCNLSLECCYTQPGIGRC
jgi:predicted ribosomally synthesized peptide with nif11-like leader